MKVQGIVLAGGKSRRFGEDKALAVVDGASMIEKAVGLLNALNLKPVVITSENRDYSSLNCQIEKDMVPDIGPLGGVYTACRLFQGYSLLILTCDMPALTIELLKLLIEKHRSETGITFFTDEKKFIHPFPGIYEAKLLADIEAKIQQKRYAMHEFISSMEHHAIPGAEYREWLRNINYKRDLS